MCVADPGPITARLITVGGYWLLDLMFFPLLI